MMNSETDADRTFEDPELKAALELVLKESEKITRSIEDTTSVTDEYIRNDYNWVAFVHPLEFAHSRWKLMIVLILFSINVLSNWQLYTRYLKIESETYGFVYNALVPIAATGAVVSISFIQKLLDRWKSHTLARFVQYVAYAELLAIIGVQFQMFWAAIASWGGIFVYVVLNIDLGWIKPNKQVQVELARSLREDRR